MNEKKELLEWIKKWKYPYSINDVIYTVVDVCKLRIFIQELFKE